MSEPLSQDTFVGPHPTNGQFVDKLASWGFTHRKTDGVHLVFRAPGGGTLRVLRSLLGRADAGVVDKAARLVGVTVDQFWAVINHPWFDLTGRGYVLTEAGRSESTG